MAPANGLLGVFDASPVPTAITRAADGLILAANQACLELLGWRDGRFVGRSTVDVGFWVQPGRRAAMLEQLARAGVVRDFEQEIVTRSGEARVVLTSISRVEFDGLPCLVGHVHDITDRRRLEEQLRESEERFRQVTETLQHGFMLSDVDPPAVLYASPAVARVWGIDLDRVYRDPSALMGLIHPDDLEEVVSRRREMTGASELEFRIVRPDGETRWIRARAAPVGMKDGHAVRIAAVSEDVTAARALADALRDSEERFRLLAENSSDVIGRLAADQRIVYVSPASRSVYGYEPEAMVGRFGWEFLHPEDLAAMTDDFSDRADEPDVITSRYRVLRGDGEYVWVEARIRTLRDPRTGEVVEFHTIARDIGERQRAEAELHRAQEEAERANAAKSEFLSRMSHELRTPLHAILGFGDLLARDDLRPAQCEHLRQITKAGRHLLELINEVLELSRIEEGGLSMSLEPVHVGQVVRETLEMLAPLAAARTVILAPARCAEQDLHVLADRQRLKQVLLNLVSNALKYNRAGGDARVAATLAGPASARIEVTDTGIGIAPDDLAAAFAPFERLGAETTDVEGTGLGLALAKRLVEAMGGTIGADSEIGRGTTFWMQLPAVPAPAVRPAEKAAPAPRAPRMRSQARKILYIEDNPSNIKLVEAMLRRRPEVTLLVAQQGSLGLELAREHVPALVLLDVNLPDIQGDEVLRRLRGDARTAQAVVVMVTADATPDQVARLRNAGADGYLTKPFELDEFLAIVDDAAAPHPLRPPTVAPAADEPLDPSLLDRVRGLYPDGRRVKELVDLYLDDSPTRLDELVAAAVADDAEAVRQVAHAWRGSCSVTGANRLAALLHEVESGARDGAVPSSRRLDAVRHSFEEARAALRERYP
ncbi:MAG: hypothetical protein QOD69_3027 [Solirubrobacteraceae bacterium]|nr:hypothetical protein [Solirubrobacteraceae bacterium]